MKEAEKPPHSSLSPNREGPPSNFVEFIVLKAETFRYFSVKPRERDFYDFSNNFVSQYTRVTA